MQEVAGGAFDADFFDDGDVLSGVDSGAESDEQLGPLKEGRGGRKMAKKKPKGKKPAAKKGGAGAKRKAGGGGGGPAKKPKK